MPAISQNNKCNNKNIANILDFPKKSVKITIREGKIYLQIQMH